MHFNFQEIFIINSVKVTKEVITTSLDPRRCPSRRPRCMGAGPRRGAGGWAPSPCSPCRRTVRSSAPGRGQGGGQQPPHPRSRTRSPHPRRSSRGRRTQGGGSSWNVNRVKKLFIRLGAIHSPNNATYNTIVPTLLLSSTVNC